VHVYVVFAHPSQGSFTHAVLEAFVEGLRDAGHTFEIGDLYAMGFPAEMDLALYERETSLDPRRPVPEFVAAEQRKIARATALAFVYPVWWSDCPAKLKNWFDCVWSYGYAYGYEDGKHVVRGLAIERALVLCSAGHPVGYLEQTGIAAAMRRIMLEDRLLGVGIPTAAFEILGGMLGNDPEVRQQNLDRARHVGRSWLSGELGKIRT
jgi:NAD(P)H dehydrogenase (quinone)